jgi:PAS domain-containing protein
VIPIANPDAVLITNRGGFIQSMNVAAAALLGLSDKQKARPGQIGALFVKGRVAVRHALREVHPGGVPVERVAWILPTGRALAEVTVNLTGLDDGFRFVLRPITLPARSGVSTPRRIARQRIPALDS